MQALLINSTPSIYIHRRLGYEVKAALHSGACCFNLALPCINIMSSIAITVHDNVNAGYAKVYDCLEVTSNV